ncbi:MAG: YjjG family noncanonical pyrimidine nucleotidase [Clostridiales bacterium]|nr:YjjG family noncanonical pyrimidine nucleotidase [Clostridiales bacterium]
MKFDHIFIDIDDTLFDFSKAERASLENLFNKHGLPFDDEFLSKYRKHNLKLWQDIEKGVYTTADLSELRFDTLVDKERFSSHEDYLKFSDGYIEELACCPFVFDDAKPMLDKLYGKCNMYIVTNGVTRVQYNRLKASGFDRYFNKIFISEEIGLQKPLKKFFEYIFREENITDKSRCIILGDSLTSDMQGGRNAGITTCRIVRNKKIKPNSLCDYQITGLDEFVSLVMQGE